MSDSYQDPVRVLCLGNDLLADDAIGGAVAERISRWADPEIEVVYAANVGFSLIDFMLNTRKLVVVDSVLTGTSKPGSLAVLREEDARVSSGGSPHYVGLFEALALARELRLSAPEEVVIVAVEVADRTTVGGRMSAAVEAAIPAVLEVVRDLIASFSGDERQQDVSGRVTA